MKTILICGQCGAEIDMGDIREEYGDLKIIVEDCSCVQERLDKAREEGYDEGYDDGLSDGGENDG